MGGPGSGRTAVPAAERFWKKVANPDTKTGCRLWTGGTQQRDGSYRGIFWVGGDPPTVSAHRFMWTLMFGEIPEGKQVRRTCGNTQCVEPSHLQMG